MEGEEEEQVEQGQEVVEEEEQKVDRQELDLPRHLR